jgi:antitoxin ParD1/3/4
MTVQMTPETEELVQTLVAAGAYPNESAVVEEAVRLLQQRDQLRTQIRQGLDELDRGERISADVVFDELRARLGHTAE